MDSRWADTLDVLVRRALADPSETAVEACLEQAQQCDCGDGASVSHAFDRMLRLAEQLWITFGPDAAHNPIVLTINVALTSLEVMQDPGYVIGLSRALQARGLHGYSLLLLDHACGIEVPPLEPAALPPLAEVYNHRGDTLRRLGRLDDAYESLTAALQLVPPDNASGDALRSAVLNNLGLVLVERGEHLPARRFLIESLELSERSGEDPLSIAVTLDNLGHIETELAAQAGPLWISDEYINATTDQHLRQAEDYFSRAAELFEAGLPDSAEDYVICLLNRADVATQRDDDAMLEELSREAYEWSQDERVTDATAQHALSLRGEVLLGQGGVDAAVELLRPWFEDVVSVTAPHDRPVRGLMTLLSAAARLGDTALADRVAQAVVETDDEMLVRRLAGASQAAARAMFGEYARRAETVLGHCLPADAYGVAPLWLYTMLLNRKGVLAERQGAVWLRSRFMYGADDELLDQIRSLRAEAARVDLDGSGERSITAARQRHDDTVRRLNELETELYRVLGDAWMPRVDVATVQARLAADTTLIDLTAAVRPDGQRHFVAFFVGGDGQPQYRWLGSSAALSERLSALTAACAQPQAERVPAPPLLEPTDPVGRHLIVAPTGVWGMAPIGLLLDADGEPLIAGHTVTAVPSARWLVMHVPDTLLSRDPVVIGDPDFDLDFAEQVSFFLSLRLRQLEHAGTEAALVAANLGVTPTIGRAASRAAILGVNRPRILHIATHGVFIDAIGSIVEQSEPRTSVMRMVAGAIVTSDDDVLGFARIDSAEPADAKSRHRSRVRWLQTIGPSDQQSRSALLLSGFNAWLAGVETPPEIGTGMLSAAEFSLLDLTSTALVVLSACETGVGAVDYADGTLLGFRSAALAAGATSCVSTLWKVADAPTAALMSGFYGHLANGMRPRDALRAAQLGLRETQPDPYYWAGWVLDGDG